MPYDFLKTDDNRLNEGASEDLLRHVETTLGLPLPRAWKEFLAFSNGAVISTEIRLFPARMEPVPGNPEEDAHEEDLISANQDQDELLYLKEDVIIIGRYFDSDLFCYLRKDAGKDDPPIYFFDHEEVELEKDADNVLEFLNYYNGFLRPKNRRKRKLLEIVATCGALLICAALFLHIGPLKLFLIVAGFIVILTGLTWLIRTSNH